MNRQEIELAEALAGALDGPDEHVLGPTDAALVVRALRAAAAQARAMTAQGWAACFADVLTADAKGVSAAALAN